MGAGVLSHTPVPRLLRKEPGEWEPRAGKVGTPVDEKHAGGREEKGKELSPKPDPTKLRDEHPLPTEPNPPIHKPARVSPISNQSGAVQAPKLTIIDEEDYWHKTVNSVNTTNTKPCNSKGTYINVSNYKSDKPGNQ